MVEMSHSTRSRHPVFAGLWVRLVTVLCFLSAVLYTQVHLAVEEHVHGFEARPVELEAGGWELQEITGEDHHHHADLGHLPHSASEHAFRLALYSGTLSFSGEAEPASVVVDLVRPPLYLGLFLTERQNPPGLRLPDPLQPRAPPIA
jgi:hypothetical protein